MPAKTFDRYPLIVSDRDGKNPRGMLRAVRLGPTVILLGPAAKYPDGKTLSATVAEVGRFDGTISNVRGSRGAWLIVDTDGKEWLVKKDPAGCSCSGDPVRSYRLKG